MASTDTVAALRSFWLKHRVSIIDLGILAAILGVLAYVAFAVDIFANESGVPEKTLTFELDEIMLLGGLLMLGLLVFAIRRYVAARRETARRIKAEQKARELAYQDPLTGLANRRQFNEALDVALRSPAGSEAVHALLLLDLNSFKQVNDVYGHGVGDELLIIVAQRLLTAVRDNDLVARFGGDEFAVLSQSLMGPEAAATIAQRIIAALDTPIVIGSVRHNIGVGIGITLLGDEDAAEAQRKADLALYRAKAERRSAFRFFAEEMDTLIRDRDALERSLRAAVERGEITTLYQPTVDLATGRVVGFEASPAWIDAAGREVPSARFLPIAEETGLVHALAEQTLRHACAAASAWPANVRLAIDLYPGQFTDPGLAGRMLDVLSELRVAPGRLDVEISESALVQNAPGLRAILSALHEAGVRLTLDHFGTGYSTLYHLREFKLDRIKIDRSFVESGDAEGRKVLSALAGLGHGLGMAVAADGIDGLGGSDIALSGIQQGQGDAFGRALSAAEALAAVSSPRAPLQKRA